MKPRIMLFALLLAAAPALAQMSPPPPPSGAGQAMPGPGMRGPGMPGPGMRGPGMRGPGMFPSVSEAGRAILRDAMLAGGDRKAQRQQIEDARERMMSALDAERFDAGAVKRAMDDERNVADASHQARQSAMLAAFQKLSVADRKAFVADSRAMKARMEQRIASWRDNWREKRRGRGGMGDMPPPPPQD